MKLKYMVVVFVMGAVKHDTDATPNPSRNDGRQCERGVKEEKPDPLETPKRPIRATPK